jgi:hypothetical protein
VFFASPIPTIINSRTTDSDICLPVIFTKIKLRFCLLIT